MRERFDGTGLVRACVCVAVVLATAACGDDDGGAGSTPPGPPAPADGGDDHLGPEDGPSPDGEVPEHLREVSAGSWSGRAPAPRALTEVDAAAFDGELWVVGGIAGDASVVADVQIYDPATDSWRRGPDLPEPVHHAALVATDDTLVLLGGYRTLAFDPIDDAYVLDADRAGWVPGPVLPEPRGAGAAEFDGTRIVYGGGIGPGGLAADVWALAELDGAWEELGELSIARDHLDAASDRRGTVWFLAGREAGLDRNLGTVDLVTTDGVAPLGELPTPRGGVAAFHLDGIGACLAGGEEPERTFAEVECIDAEGEITTLPSLSEPRHGLGADVIDGIVLVALGGPEPRLAVSPTLEALRP